MSTNFWTISTVCRPASRNIFISHSHMYRRWISKSPWNIHKRCSNRQDDQQEYRRWHDRGNLTEVVCLITLFLFLFYSCLRFCVILFSALFCCLTYCPLQTSPVFNLIIIFGFTMIYSIIDIICSTMVYSFIVIICFTLDFVLLLSFSLPWF